MRARGRRDPESSPSRRAATPSDDPGSRRPPSGSASTPVAGLDTDVARRVTAVLEREVNPGPRVAITQTVAGEPGVRGLTAP